MWSKLWSLTKANWRLYAAILAAFVLCGTLSYCKGVSDGKEIANASIAKKDAATVDVVRKADEEVAVSHEKATTDIKAKATARAAKTEKVLEQESDWANQPVPDAVLDGLRNNP